MRSTLNIDDDLLSEAERVTGVSEKTALMGGGLGYVDMHLLAFSLLSDCQLWTKDKRSAATGKDVGGPR